MNNSGAVEDTPIMKLLKMERDIEKCIETLERIAGREMYFNDYKDTIISLKGILSGFKIKDNILGRS